MNEGQTVACNNGQKADIKREGGTKSNSQQWLKGLSPSSTSEKGPIARRGKAVISPVPVAPACVCALTLRSFSECWFMR
eukprot:3403179-Pleurochrysis_carterae.AAC.1